MNSSMKAIDWVVVGLIVLSLVMAAGWFNTHLKAKEYAFHRDLLQTKLEGVRNDAICITFDPVLKADSTIDAPFLREICS